MFSSYVTAIKDMFASQSQVSRCSGRLLILNKLRLRNDMERCRKWEGGEYLNVGVTIN